MHVTLARRHAQVLFFVIVIVVSIRSPSRFFGIVIILSVFIPENFKVYRKIVPVHAS